MQLQIKAPPGWTTDKVQLGTDTYWADTGSGQNMAESYGLGKATPIMCLTGGDVLYLIQAGSSLYLWSPMNLDLWKITQKGSLQEIVDQIGEQGGLIRIDKELVDE